MTSKPFIEVHKQVEALINDSDCPDVYSIERACNLLLVDVFEYKEKLDLVTHLLEKWIDFEEINVYIKC